MSNSYKILVTGGSGMVGSELISQLLEKGESLIAIYNKTKLSQFENNVSVNIVQCDILDTYRLEELMVGIEKVYHCAALVSFDPRLQSQLFTTNIEGTLSIVNACIASGVRKLVFVSSVSAMGRIREDEMITENMYWSEKTSNSAYGKSKYLAEMEVWRGIGEGLEGIIVNPTIILGGTSWEKGSTAIYKTAYGQFPWYTDGISGFVSVKDVCRAMILLMDSTIINERFILNAVNTTYKNIFTLIAKQFNKRPPFKKVTRFISGLVWRLELVKAQFSGKKPLLTKETAYTAQAKVTFNNDKIKQYLPGFEFEPIEKTIENSCTIMKVKYNL